MTIDECLKLLSVTERPTRAAVKKAFRQAALKHHPDTRGSDKEFIRVKVAYDTLMALPTDELERHSSPNETTDTPAYNPFNDLDYDKRTFFSPENLSTEGFERKLRAKGCPHCDGYGFVTKNTDPSRGFMGRERRLCKCQWA